MRKKVKDVHMEINRNKIKAERRKASKTNIVRYEKENKIYLQI